MCRPAPIGTPKLYSGKLDGSRGLVSEQPEALFEGIKYWFCPARNRAETILLFIDLLALFSVFSEPKGAGQVLGWYLYTTHKYTKYTPCYNLRTFFPPQEYSMTALFT
jgi:hypothetical protein